MKTTIKEAACILLIFALFYSLLILGEDTKTAQPKKTETNIFYK
jgi:hypothetical protein